ncbi:hypothetical protein N7491_006355 [Penicillium cf. griseofulvum]|nr:hypothetical protein N7491_006355 [Penicillium cf. griseofulvum]
MNVTPKQLEKTTEKSLTERRQKESVQLKATLTPKNAIKPPNSHLHLIPKPSYPIRHSHWSPIRPHGSEADMATPDSGATSPFPVLSRAIDLAPYTLSPKHPRIRDPEADLKQCNTATSMISQ